MLFLLDEEVVSRRAGMVRLRSHDVNQNASKGANSVLQSISRIQGRQVNHTDLVPPHHHVAEANVIVNGDLAFGDSRVQVFLVELDVLQHTQPVVVVA